MNSLFAVGALLLGVITMAYADPPDFPLIPAAECHPRQGLPHFFDKARTPGADIKIAYLGGSITAQPGWRPKTLAYFQKIYPNAKFSEINAAIGGTGSDLGVFRLKQDVLDKKTRPALCRGLRSMMGERRRCRYFAAWRGSFGKRRRRCPGATSVLSTPSLRVWPRRCWRGNSPAPPALWRRSRSITESRLFIWPWRSPG